MFLYTVLYEVTSYKFPAPASVELIMVKGTLFIVTLPIATWPALGCGEVQLVNAILSELTPTFTVASLKFVLGWKSRGMYTVANELPLQ